MRNPQKNTSVNRVISGRNRKCFCQC